MNNFRVLTIFTILTVYLSQPTQQAAHTHAKKKDGHGGEREADGAFSPRDKHHGGSGEHDAGFDHEAIIGSRKEAEEFDDLSPEEAKQRLRILLTKMDRDNDESVDRNELYAWILRSFKALSQEDSDDRFEDADGDEDGFVTWDEYYEDEYDFGDEKNPDLSDPAAAEEWKLMEEDKILFQAADMNQDGKLDNKEYLAFTHPEEDPSMKPHVLRQVLEEKDDDKDGQLSFQEYVGVRGKDKDKEWLIEEKDRFDNELDRNGDNVLSKEEIHAWIIPSNEEIAKDEVDHLFAGADEDMNEYLTFEEVIRNHELFVGSEATDYGEHLTKLHKFEDEL